MQISIKTFLTTFFFFFYFGISAQEKMDLTGEWQLLYRMPDGAETISLNINRNDSSILASSSIGQFEIDVEGDRVSWSYPLCFRRGRELATFKGIVNRDDYLKGVFIVHEGAYRGRAVKWKAYRIQSD